MKIQLKPYVLALLCVGCLTGPAAHAETAKNSHNKTMSLETEIATLKKEMRALKHQLAFNTPPQQDIGQRKQLSKRIGRQNDRCEQVIEPSTTTESPQEEARDATILQANPPPSENKMSKADLMSLFAQQKAYLPFDLDVPGQSFVSTGPYVGVPIQFSGSNLIVNSPSVNTDLQLLGIRKIIHKQLNAMGGMVFSEPYHSHLLMSGLIEAQAGYVNNGGEPSRSSVDVTNVSLDLFYLGPSKWLLGFAEFMYNNGSPRQDVWDSHNSYTVANSRLFVNKAFITIGDLDESRFYGTFGQFYVPFGTYSSVMVSDTLPKLLGRTKARAILVGFAPCETSSFFASAYIFRGDSHAASVSKINNGGINVGYVIDIPHLSGKVGAGVIGNIADSGGMQLGNQFANYEQIVHRVPAYNLRAAFDIYEHFDLLLEWVGASTRFNPNDMSFNGHGAKPSAFDIQAAYSFNILCDRPSSIGIGYGKSNQALSLGVPLTRKSIVFNTSLWRHTLQSIEIRRDTNYAESNTANGPIFSPVPADSTCKSLVCSSSGRSDTAITAQFDYYF